MVTVWVGTCSEQACPDFVNMERRGTRETRGLDVNTWISHLGDWGGIALGVLECRYLRDMQVDTWTPSLHLEMKCALGRGPRGHVKSIGIPRRLLLPTFQRNILILWARNCCVPAETSTSQRVNGGSGNEWVSKPPRLCLRKHLTKQILTFFSDVEMETPWVECLAKK